MVNALPEGFGREAERFFAAADRNDGGVPGGSVIKSLSAHFSMLAQQLFSGLFTQHCVQ